MRISGEQDPKRERERGIEGESACKNEIERE